MLLIAFYAIGFLSLKAQNQYPTSKNSSLLLDGGTIHLIKPETSSGWARGFVNRNSSSTNIGGVGLYGEGNNPMRYYIAHGSSPWSSNLGLYVLTNGNIGIGTLAPIDKLHVENGYIRLRSLTNTNNASHPAGLKFSTDNSGAYSQILVRRGSDSQRLGLQFNTYDNGVNETMTIIDEKVGIGTTSPLDKLHVENGYIRLRSLANTNNSSHSTGLNFSTDNSGAYSQILVRRGPDSQRLGLQFNTYDNGVNETMTIIDGKVGIGITTPQYKLDVAGTVRACEVKVNIDNGCGADFVFESDYYLRPLEEVDQFVKENQHLPEIASAKEMEENGVNMAEFQIQLLQKIEELTLYTIEQQKLIEKMAERIEVLEGE